MIIRRKIGEMIRFIRIMRNSQERVPYLKSKMTLMNLIKFGLFSWVLIYPIFNFNIFIFNLSVSRLVSRLVGTIGDCKLPLFMRSTVLNSYIKFYKVNREEILDPELNNYETVKDFFIRKIKLDKRPIEDSSDEILSSPCDGRIFSFSEIKNFNEIFFVKKFKDTLTLFLFGFYPNNIPAFEIFNKNKRYYQLTIYLSPGDCHRYYSPANMSVSNRIYIPGFLAPVKPSYVLKHPNTFSTNERVTLVCKYLNQQKQDDLLFMTFVGALNVGSINLSFDQKFRSNKDMVLPKYNHDSEFYSADYRKQNKDTGFTKNRIGSRSDQGFLFSKKDELGWFNFGSTIVLVFSCDKDKEIISKFKEGEQVKIGQSLIQVVKN